MSDVSTAPTSLQFLPGKEYQVLTDIRYAELKNHPTKPNVQYYQFKSGIKVPFIVWNVRIIRDETGAFKLASFDDNEPTLKPASLISAVIMMIDKRAADLTALVFSRYSAEPTVGPKSLEEEGAVDPYI